MSNYRSQPNRGRGHDARGGGRITYHDRTDSIKAVGVPPPPPVDQGSSRGRRPPEHQNYSYSQHNERQRSRSRSPPPGQFHHNHNTPSYSSRECEVPTSVRQQQTSSFSRKSGPTRHEEHSERTTSSSRRQEQSSSQDSRGSFSHDTRESRRGHHAEPTKHTGATSKSRRSPSPRNRSSSRKGRDHTEPTKRTRATSNSRRSSSPSPRPHKRDSSRNRKQSSSTPKSSKLKTPSNDSQSHSQSSTATGHSSKTSASFQPATIPESELMNLINKEDDVIRKILNPDNVKIPRRSGEGAKPIFDRDELRESIQRRMTSGDNEQNPTPDPPFVQRVIAVIREPAPALIDPFTPPPKSTPTSSRQVSDNVQVHHREPSPELRTSSGLQYRLPSSSSSPASPPRKLAKKSFSPIRPPPEDRERERERDEIRVTERRKDRHEYHHHAADFGGEHSRSHDSRNHLNPTARQERSRSRSRSRSPPLDRVRRVTLNPAAPQASLSFTNRNSRERDLRENLSRAPKTDFMVPEREVVVPPARGPGPGRGGRGVFPARRGRGGSGFRGKGGRGAFGGRPESRWQHDKYDRDGGGGGGDSSTLI